jgi:hypothetical protein
MQISTIMHTQYLYVVYQLEIRSILIHTWKFKLLLQTSLVEGKSSANNGQEFQGNLLYKLKQVYVFDA